MKNRFIEQGERRIEKYPAGTKLYPDEHGKLHPTTDDDPRATHMLFTPLYKDLDTGEAWQAPISPPLI